MTASIKIKSSYRLCTMGLPLIYLIWKYSTSKFSHTTLGYWLFIIYKTLYLFLYMLLLTCPWFSRITRWKVRRQLPVNVLHFQLPFGNICSIISIKRMSLFFFTVKIPLSYLWDSGSFLVSEAVSPSSHKLKRSNVPPTILILERSAFIS